MQPLCIQDCYCVPILIRRKGSICHFIHLKLLLVLCCMYLMTMCSCSIHVFCMLTICMGLIQRCTQMSSCDFPSFNVGRIRGEAMSQNFSSRRKTQTVSYGWGSSGAVVEVPFCFPKDYLFIYFGMAAKKGSVFYPLHLVWEIFSHCHACQS